MEFDAVRRSVCEANLAIVDAGLVTLTWGNASGRTPDGELFAIKPSGVPYAELRPEQIVVVRIADGVVVAGDCRASSDTPTHRSLYLAWPEVGGIVHTHSKYATMFAQARREIPCLGTTHADHFCGPIPVARPLTSHEVAEAYEAHSGAVLVELFAGQKPLATPGALLAGHAPFAWGATVARAVENAIALEAVAEMAMGTMQLQNPPPTLESYVLDKHYYRKHGPDAYYGQK